VPRSAGGAEHEAWQSPLWRLLIERTELGIEAVPALRERSANSVRATADSVTVRAHRRLLAALGADTSVADETVTKLTASAVEIVIEAAGLSESLARSDAQGREVFVRELRRRLGAYEGSVRAGEMTYSLAVAECEGAASRVRKSIAAVSNGQTSQGVLSLRSAVVDLAAVLIRAAANAQAGHRAGEAPEDRTGALDGILHKIVTELVDGDRQVDRPVNDSANVVAHHLAAGLRVRVSDDAPEGFTSPPAAPRVDPALRARARAAWLRLATCEYVAVKALDHQLETPSYSERFASLPAAITEGAANVICGARLNSRPDAFRHRAAWDHQTVALSYAMEAYVAGLRGDARSLEQAQLITLTRLVRAVAAIALLDIPRFGSPTSNGGSKQ
jgi:hypothetical protein